MYNIYAQPALNDATEDHHGRHTTAKVHSETAGGGGLQPSVAHTDHIGTLSPTLNDSEQLVQAIQWRHAAATPCSKICTNHRLIA